MPDLESRKRVTASILQPPSPKARARFADNFGRRFMLTVDTEEEFDWSREVGKGEYGLDHVPRLRKFQEFCENEGVVPVYLVDWPIATSTLAAEILKEPLARGDAEIGIQLHPWVNPPIVEEINDRNSYSGNLPRELEAEKLLRLRQEIEKNFGVMPVIYRAGRYGVGPATVDILREQGVAIDTSVRSQFDYSYLGGPNFRDHPVWPYWLDEAQSVLELPLTTVFWGLLRKQGRFLYPALWRAPRIRGLLAGFGLLERIPLTPEGVTVDEAIRGIDIALDDGLELMVFSFHSPSLTPGNTPYVRSEEDLDRLYDWWRRVFAYLEQRGIAPAGVRQVMDGVIR